MKAHLALYTILLALNIKQIMTGLEDRGTAEVNRNSWGGDPESQGANRSAYYPRDQSLFVLLYHYVTQRKFNWKLISSTMGLVTKTHTFEWP